MIRPFQGKRPRVHASCYIDPSAQLIGDVRLGERASIWPNCAVRADLNYIEIGEETNIQDNCVLHVQSDIPLLIGARVTLGHHVVAHACTIEDRALIGMGAIVLDRAVISSESIVAAGAVVPMGMVVPPRSLVAGVPARIKKELTDADVELIDRHWRNYVQYTAAYLQEPDGESE
jgi:carbonic anhydrase/acetyltransferase-like protein (isoleucine patch superfamily)